MTILVVIARKLEYGRDCSVLQMMKTVRLSVLRAIFLFDQARWVSVNHHRQAIAEFSHYAT